MPSPPSMRPFAVPVGTIPLGTVLGECPVWRPETGMVTITDAAGACLYDIDPSTGSTRRRPLAVPVAALASTTSGDLLVACGDGPWRLGADDERRRLPTPDLTAIRFNDGACDARGRFWVGSRAIDGAADGGILFRLDPDGIVQAMDRGFGVCNGLGWSPDARHFYLIDTVPRLLYRYACDPMSGALGDRVILSRFEGIAGKPDGLAIDAIGRLWVAMWYGGGIAILSPEGSLIDVLATPAPRPTSCAFGGADLRTLIVTTATTGLDPADDAFGRSGDLLVYTVDTPGLATGTYG